MNEITDLRHLMPPIFDQGRRPTCLAVSASDAHQVQLPDIDQLSIEFLYYNSMKSSGQTKFDGLAVEDVSNALILTGQPEVTDWPYLNSQPCVNTWSPPAGIGDCYKGELENVATSISSVKSLISSGHPVILGLSVRDSLLQFKGAGHLDQNCNGVIRGYHAVLAVSWDGTNGGRICIRNSWGSGWGQNGHAWITESYLISNVIFGAKIQPLKEFN